MGFPSKNTATPVAIQIASAFHPEREQRSSRMVGDMDDRHGPNQLEDGHSMLSKKINS
jgi:hypothetical protein